MGFDRIIVDGNFLARTSFEVHKKLTAKVDGKTYPTGMTHGFIHKLCNLKREYNGQIFVVWDSGIRRRRLIDSEYKRERRNKDQEWTEKELYLESKKLLKWFLDMIGVCQVWKRGEEGDDIMFTLSRWFLGTSLLVTNDHDLYQAIHDRVFQLVTKRNGEHKLFTVERLKRIYGVDPQGFTYAMALAGCSGDGVKGVPGVGMKTALGFVATWPTFVPTLLGFNFDGKIVDWYPLVDNRNIVVKETPYFPEGGKGPSKRLKDCIENAELVVKTHKLIQLYDCWPVTIKRKKPDPEGLESALDRFKFHDLSTRFPDVLGLSKC